MYRTKKLFIVIHIAYRYATRLSGFERSYVAPLFVFKIFVCIVPKNNISLYIYPTDILHVTTSRNSKFYLLSELFFFPKSISRIKYFDKKTICLSFLIHRGFLRIIYTNVKFIMCIGNNFCQLSGILSFLCTRLIIYMRIQNRSYGMESRFIESFDTHTTSLLCHMKNVPREQVGGGLFYINVDALFYFILFSCRCLQSAPLHSVPLPISPPPRMCIYLPANSRTSLTRTHLHPHLREEGVSSVVGRLWGKGKRKRKRKEYI